ncbi:MAG: hypothetical protein DRP02_13100 [Candidatus Gerdarchaeota archaeon]|nr:MAG: hypothetical protein DRP02_13100 [Candidatus Gerdarchaeota archaeon]
MIETIKDFYAGACDTAKLFDEFVAKHGLSEIAKADHLCYKCDSSKVFLAMREFLEANSKWSYTSPIAGRRISVIRLNEPITTSLGDISIIELSDQKPDGSQTNRFDHIEIYSTSGDYEGLAQHLKDRGLNVNEVVRPHHTTYDVRVTDTFIVRLTEGPLADKIREEQTN